MTGRTFGLVIAASMLLFASGAPAQPKSAEPIVLSGQQANGAPAGVVHGRFSGSGGAGNPNPAIGDDGFVHFESRLDGPPNFASSLWRGGLVEGGSPDLTRYWFAGDAAPETEAGVSFANVTKIAPNGLGQTAFIGRVEGPGVTVANRDGVWAGSPGALSLVARTDRAAPGTGDTFATGITDLVYNDRGDVGFRARTTDGRNGLWVGAPGSLRALAVQGADAPGFGAGVTFFAFNPSDALRSLGLNNRGEAVFFSQLTGAGSGSPETIWTGMPDALGTAAVEGQDAPETNSTFSSFGRAPSINDNGEVVFSGTTRDNLSGVWAGAPGALSLIARGGEPAPGLDDGVQFSSFRQNPVINDRGDVAFLGGVRGAVGTVDDSIWLGRNGALIPIAVEDQSAPMRSDGTLFSFFNGGPVINNRGQIVFEAVLQGGDTGRALFATDGTDKITFSIGLGDLFDIGTGELVTILNFSFLDEAGSSDGRPSGFNDQGQLSFWASFEGENGTLGQGIFVTEVSAVPIPAALPLLLSAIAGLGWYFRRRPGR